MADAGRLAIFGAGEQVAPHVAAIATVGSDAPDKRELGLDLLSAAVLVCDVTHQCARVRLRRLSGSGRGSRRGGVSGDERFTEPHDRRSVGPLTTGARPFRR